MRKAIEMAQFALDSDETPVGCVFVRDGEVIGRGINGTNASLNVSFFDFVSFVFLRFGGFGRVSFLVGRDGEWNLGLRLLEDLSH